MCMRTNIDLNDELLEQAMQLSTAQTKKAVVEEALRTFVEVKAARLRRESYRDRLASVRARTTSMKSGRSVVDILRDDRSRS